MSQTAIDISCPHCKQSYRIKVDLDRLSRVRTRAVCARCGQRFDVAARLRTSESAPRPADAKTDIQELANASERREFGNEPRASSAPMLASRPPTTELTRSIAPQERTSAPPRQPSTPPETGPSPEGSAQVGAVVSGGRTWFSAGAPGENRDSNVAALKPSPGGVLPPSLPPEVLDDEFDRVFTDITARASTPPAVLSETPRARLSDSPEVVITSVPPDDDTNFDFESDVIEMDGNTNSGSVIPGPTRPPQPAALTAPPAPREPRPRMSTPAQGFSIPSAATAPPVVKTAPPAPITPSQRPVGWSVPPQAAREARAVNRSLTPARMTAPPRVSSPPPRRLTWLEHAYPGFDGLVARETCDALGRLLDHDPRQRPVDSRPPERK